MTFRVIQKSSIRRFERRKSAVMCYLHRGCPGRKKHLHTSQLPVRSDAKYIQRPSRDQLGTFSFEGSLVSLRAGPPGESMTKISGFPAVRESNTIRWPSGDQPWSSRYGRIEVVPLHQAATVAPAHPDFVSTAAGGFERNLISISRCLRTTLSSGGGSMILFGLHWQKPGT